MQAMANVHKNNAKILRSKIPPECYPQRRTLASPRDKDRLHLNLI